MFPLKQPPVLWLSGYHSILCTRVLFPPEMGTPAMQSMQISAVSHSIPYLEASKAILAGRFIKMGFKLGNWQGVRYR